VFLLSGLTACPSSVGPIPIGCGLEPTEIFTSQPGIVRVGVPARLRVGPTVPIDECDGSTEVSGFEPGILWTKDQSAGPNQGLLRQWRLSGDQLVEQGSLFLGTLTSVSDRPILGWASVPVLRNTFPTESAFPTFAVPT
jgi:hypothetical protein